MDPTILESHESPPGGEPYVLLNEAPDGLITITAVKRDTSGALFEVTDIDQPPWPDGDDIGRDTAEALAHQLGTRLYLRRRA
jgi:hypothetical protein